MHRISVVGASWRHNHAEALAALTIPREEREERVARLARALGVPELVYVATCNRVEVAFASDGPPLPHHRRTIFAELAGRMPREGEAEHALRAWQGEGAAEHLFVVTSGLDSARVGESEITGQVRDAIEQSARLGLLGPHLETVLGEALKVAKRIRPLTEGRVGKVSLAETAMRYVVERVARTPGRVALVGVSPMTEQCARALAARQIPVLIVNRTVERAEALALELGARACALGTFRESPEAVEAVVVATGAKEPVLRRSDLERLAARTASGEAPLVVDFAVPPNVTPEDAVAADVPRIGMDEITLAAAEDREQVLADFAEARAVVDEALTGLRRLMAERLVAPMIAQLHRRYRHTAMEGVERLFKRDLAGLGEAEREAVRRWAETLARRFAHLPAVGLRDLVFQSGPGAVEAFFSHAEPELARELHEAAHRTGVGLLVDGEFGDA